MSRRLLAPEATVLEGDCRDVLPALAAESYQCCVTSPPYWGLSAFSKRRRGDATRAPSGRSRSTRQPGEHKARFPLELPRRCILAGSARDDRVLDPFGGGGTTGRAAVELGRSATLIEIHPETAVGARHRSGQLGL